MMATTVTRTKSQPITRRPSDARLLVVFPPESNACVALTADKLIAGREQPGAGGMDHPTVSRQHFEIAWDGRVGAHVLRDLGSHNGTQVNGQDVGDREVALEAGDIVRAGDVLAVYDVGPKPKDAPVPPDLAEAVPGMSLLAEHLRVQLQRCAPDPAPALLIGETGTGKEFAAAAIHRLSGRSGRFVPVNCAALAPNLVESQLFGHERGAFTGATGASPGYFRAADGGTLFLDEIGELPLEQQPKLLRALQEGEVYPVGRTDPVKVRVRVIAATNRDLTKAVEEALFRRDLYARLALWEIRVPRLADRRADVLGWVHRFYERYVADRPGGLPPTLELEPDVAELLLLYGWPENLRGLDRFVHEVATRARPDEPVGLGDAPAWLLAEESESADEEPGGSRERRPAPETRADLEAVLAAEGSVRATAKYYGRDRRQIYRWMRAFGIEGGDS